MISIADVTKEVKDALIKLGYSVYNHNVGVHRVMVDLFKVYYDDQYFGVWDASRKTFID